MSTGAKEVIWMRKRAGTGRKGVYVYTALERVSPVYSPPLWTKRNTSVHSVLITGCQRATLI